MKEQRVSCISTLAEESPVKIKRAIDCFYAQSHKSRELIIICRKGNHSARAFLQQYPVSCVYYDDRRESIESVYAKQIELSKSEYICNWSFDYWSHKDRLQYQIATLRKMCKGLSYFLFSILFDGSNRRSYITPQRIVASSLLARRNYLLLFDDALMQLFGRKLPPSSQQLADISPVQYAFLLIGIYGQYGQPLNFSSEQLFNSSTPLESFNNTILTEAFCGGRNTNSLSEQLSNNSFSGKLKYTLSRSNLMV